MTPLSTKRKCVYRITIEETTLELYISLSVAEENFSNMFFKNKFYLCPHLSFSFLIGHQHVISGTLPENKYNVEIKYNFLISDFPGGSDGKASVYNGGDPGSVPGLGRSPGKGNGNPLQDYCLENPMDRGAW